MVGIPVPIPVPMAYYSFGGWKASLLGDTPRPTAPKACTSSPEPKPSPPAGPPPATASSNSASHKTTSETGRTGTVGARSERNHQCP